MLSAYIQEAGITRPGKAGGRKIPDCRIVEAPCKSCLGVDIGSILRRLDNRFFQCDRIYAPTTHVSYKSLRFIGAVARDRIAGIGTTKYLVISISLRTDEKKSKKKA